MSKSKRLDQKQLDGAYGKALANYAHRENVTGVDIGYRYKDGQRTDELAIRVHVKEKLPKTALEAAQVFPKEIDEVPVDVIQAVYSLSKETMPEPVSGRKSRVDLLQPGVSISHPRVTAGTLGLLVYDRRTGQPCILSNWHVLAGSSEAQPGDPIVQPGQADGGRTSRDTIARLERMLLGQDGDAAIALLNGRRTFRREQWETGEVIERSRKPQVGEIAEKSGRTTGVTRGRVDGIGQYKLGYSVGTVRVDGFKLVSVRPGNPDDEEISSGGDSGSCWYSTEDGQGLGLHFAGELNSDPREEHAVACFLDRVLDRLEVSLTPTQPMNGLLPQDLISAETPSSKHLLLETVAKLARVLETLSI